MPTKRPFNAERPFPWQCRHCGKSEVVMAEVDYEAEVRHDGRLYKFSVPDLAIPVCQACGERVFTEKVDQQISSALRSHLKLLSPEQIRDGLERVGVTQKQLALSLGIAEATLSRWLNETQIQSRSLDKLLRVFFAFPQVRSVLSTGSQDAQLGTFDRRGDAVL